MLLRCKMTLGRSTQGNRMWNIKCTVNLRKVHSLISSNFHEIKLSIFFLFLLIDSSLSPFLFFLFFYLQKHLGELCKCSQSARDATDLRKSSFFVRTTHGIHPPSSNCSPVRRFIVLKSVHETRIVFYLSPFTSTFDTSNFWLFEK